MKTFDDTTQMAEFRYDKHGELLSPSGRTTAEMTIADFALMMVTFVFLMLPFMAVVAGHPQWMTPLIVVASVVAVVTFTKRGRRMWLVHRDIRAHGFKGHYEYPGCRHRLRHHRSPRTWRVGTHAGPVRSSPSHTGSMRARHHP